jgi:hypothetical protein
MASPPRLVVVYHDYGREAIVSEAQGFDFLEIKQAELFMMISAFCDESGKFDSEPAVSFAAVAGTPAEFSEFHDEWQRHLRLNGLKVLTMKRALNATKRLSQKRSALGCANRIDALLPFIECIRKRLQNIVTVAVDVEAYKNAPSVIQGIWTQDPHFLAFTRTVIALLKPLRERDTINIICDDEEKTALPVYRLYRRIKLIYADARSRLASLSFADDEVFSALQAADMVASFMRLEAKKRFTNEDYEYAKLWKSLGSPKKDDRLWGFGGSFVGKVELSKLAADEARAKKAHADRRLVSK